jgi:hypothetical protein
MEAYECGRIKHLFKSGAEILQQIHILFSLNVFLIIYVHMYIGSHKLIPELSL